MKKNISFLLLFLAVFGVAKAYDFSAVCSSGQTLYYNITGTNTVEVTSQNSNSPYYSTFPTGALVIDSTVTYNSATYSVTSIGNYAFYGCYGLTSVTIPDSVTSIGHYAFWGVKTVIYCGNATGSPWGTRNAGCFLAEGDFIYSDSTKTTLVGYTGSSSNVTIPNSVTSIGDNAFVDCSGLTSITIPNSVTSIGDYAFVGCSGLTSITIPNSVTSIGNYAFSGLNTVIYCGNATGSPWGANNAGCFLAEGDFIYSDSTKTTLVGYTGSSSNVTIPNSVTSIGNYAFYNCTGLTVVTIPNSVTSIGGDAFRICTSLTSVTIGNSVTSIGSSAFYNCTNLTSVTIGNSVTSIGDNAFYGLNTVIYCGNATGSPWGANNAGCFLAEGDFIYSDSTKSTLVGYTGSSSNVTIPNSVTSIGNYAFYNCTGLTVVTIPNSVTSIGYYAFLGVKTVIYCGNATGSPWGANNAGCFIAEGDFIYSDSTKTTLVGYTGSSSNVTIPNSVTSIGDYAFRYCSGLTSVTIPNSVTSIGYYAFYRCTGLTSVTIPNSVTSIGVYAFGYCYGLTSITSKAVSAPTLDSNAFSLVNSYIPVYVPCGSGPSYRNTWDYFSNITETFVYEFVCNTSDSAMGLVTILTQPSCNDSAKVLATANNGYHFVRWSDGATANPYFLAVTSDTSLVAVFAPGTSISNVETCPYTITTDRENITVSGAGNQRIRIFDAVGHLLATENHPTERHTFRIPASGTYLVQVADQPARKAVVIK